MANSGKRYNNLVKDIDKEKIHTLSEVAQLLKDTASTKFDEAIDIAINLGVDPRHADQMVRGAVVLRNGIGKDVKVAVFAKGAKADEAKKSGADIVGDEDLVQTVQKGEINFDRCIATPDMMGKVGTLGKVLGPKGLMPNPKLGTVTMDVADAVKQAKSGQVEFRVEKNGIVHAGIGKASFDVKAIKENIADFVRAISQAKPSGAKGTYMKKISVSCTMGPGFVIDINSVMAESA